MTQIIATPLPSPTSASTLTALDRCDYCGAQAYAKSQHAASEMLWCAHHLRANRDAIGDALVLDETWRLDKANAAFKSAD